MSLFKSLAAIVFLFFSIQVSAQQNLAGVWQGVLNIGVEAEVTLQIQKIDANNYVAILDSVNNEDKIDTLNCHISKDSVVIEGEKTDIQFAGYFVNDTALIGTWYLGRQDLPVNFLKVNKLEFSSGWLTKKPSSKIEEDYINSKIFLSSPHRLTIKNSPKSEFSYNVSNGKRINAHKEKYIWEPFNLNNMGDTNKEFHTHSFLFLKINGTLIKGDVNDSLLELKNAIYCRSGAGIFNMHNAKKERIKMFFSPLIIFKPEDISSISLWAASFMENKVEAVIEKYSHENNILKPLNKIKYTVANIYNFEDYVNDKDEIWERIMINFKFQESLFTGKFSK